MAATRVIKDESRVEWSVQCEVVVSAENKVWVNTHQIGVGLTEKEARAEYEKYCEGRTFTTPRRLVKRAVVNTVTEFVMEG